MKHAVRYFAGMTLLFALATFAFGQAESGQISGVVTDPTGAVVSGANVTATNTGTGASRTSTTSSTGGYFMTSLPPALYTLTVDATGFAPFQTQVNVTVGGRQTVDAKLAIGASTTTVEVIAGGATEVNTQNGELSQIVTSQEIQELPTITRNPYDLVATSGNISQDPAAGSNRGVGFNINGQRSASVDILLDGAENTDLFAVGVGQPTPLESTQEFRVLTSGFGPEYGRASGGVVNVVTKSGTNQFHGSVYEFNRLSTYASNDYDSNAKSIKKPHFTRNQFGFALGGPAIKDKLFFFNNSEWVRVRSQGNKSALVLDPAFIALTNANTQAFYSTYGQLGPVQPVSVITRGTIGTPAGNPNFSALPANTPVFDKINFTAPDDSGGGAPENNYNTVTRVDFNLTNKTALFGRYTLFSETDFAGFVNSSPYVGYNTGQKNYDNNLLFSLQHVFSPNVVSSSKLLFSRFNNLQPLAQQPVTPTLYFRADTTYTFQGVSFYGPGYSATTPGNAIPFGGPQNFGEFSQDLSWTKGNHQLKFGGQFLYVKDNRVFGAYEEAVEALSASGVGKSYDRLLAGQLGLFQVAISPQGKFPCPRQPNARGQIVTPACTATLPVGPPRFDRANRFRDSAVYANDTWKATPRLNLNFGLRWEYYGVQHNNNPQFDSNFYFGSGATIFDRIRSGQALITPNAPNQALWKPRYTNFAPRVGFAYDVFGDGKTAIRGGFGLGYERNFNNVTFNVIQNPPNYLVVSFTPPTDAPVINISTNNFGQFGTGTGTKALPNGTLRAVDPNIKTAYSEFYNLAVEREVAHDSTVSVAYSGSRGIHLYSIANINRTASGDVYLGDSRFGSRLNQQFGNINFRGSNGDSYYNSMNIGYRVNNLSVLGTKTGVSLTANYTYGHSIDDLSSTFSDGPANNNNLGYLDPFQPALDRGNSDFDIRHRASLSMVWEIPFAKDANPIMKGILGGWSVSPIVTMRTGAPFSVFDCNNTLFAVCPRAIFPSTPRTTGQPLGNQVDLNLFNYLTLPGLATDYGQYADPISGTGEYPTCSKPAVFGVSAASGCAWPGNMSRRNGFQGPGAWNADLGVYKNFKLTERFGMQFRSEFFNIANHPRTLIVGNGTNDVSFAVLPTTTVSGQPVANAGSPYVQAFRAGRRQIQFALKVSF